jgi:dihydrodipicolinate synthase/N-acetylneuraminate lyase
MSLRGIFPVLQTPLTKDGELDINSLKREVNFCIQAGAHGLVFPVLGSEFQFLAGDERHRLAEIVVSEASGRIPVVVGVAGQNKAEALIHAKHAYQIQADAVIALPPSTGTLEEIKDYYKAIAQTAQRPVFIQHTHADMDSSFLQSLLDEVEFVNYIKEESYPSAHQISTVLEKVGDSCLGIFGGAHGRWMLSELHRDASGFMPAAEAVDVHVQIWEAYQSGNEAVARQIFNQLLPLINLITLLGLCVCKELLIMRGIFESAAMRIPESLSLDAEDRRELEIIIEDLKPLFRVPNFA